MAATNADPLWINVNAGAPEYTANELRQLMGLAAMYDGRFMGGRKGVRPGGDQLKVSYSAPTITIQPGMCRLDPALSTPQGSYWVAIPTTDTHTLTAADGTNPRKDIVIVRVYDHDEDASGNRFARTEYLTGVAAPSPSEPTLPDSAIKLALLDVPASPGAVVVTDTRPWTVAPGGILPVRVAGDIAAGTEGRYRDRADTNVLERDSGSVWETAADPNVFKNWTSYVPVLTGTGSNPNLGTGVAIGAYKQIGKTVYDRGFIPWGTGGSGGTGFLEITWPVTPTTLANSSAGYVGAANVLDNGTTHYPAIIIASTVTARRIVITGGSANQLTGVLPFAIGADGDRISWSMTYDVP